LHHGDNLATRGMTDAGGAGGARVEGWVPGRVNGDRCGCVWLCVAMLRQGSSGFLALLESWYCSWAHATCDCSPAALFAVCGSVLGANSPQGECAWFECVSGCVCVAECALHVWGGGCPCAMHRLLQAVSGSGRAPRPTTVVVHSTWSGAALCLQSGRRAGELGERGEQED